jgi:hypothetical protein
MEKLFDAVKAYTLSLEPAVFSGCTLVAAFAVFCNYYFGINAALYALPEVLQYAGWFLVFFIVFSFGYAIQEYRQQSQLFRNRMFLFLLVAAPAIFAWKMMAHFEVHFTENAVENAYWNHVVYWPLKLLITTVALLLLWKACSNDQPFYGTAAKGFDLKPYLLMLLLMLPLIALAATQADFLRVYPKLKNVAFLENGSWYYKALYELSYGLDFFTIELFFRGFLVLAFARWVGQGAVLPMALFYCTIHFGKPLGECISSYFGGMILGAVTLHTGTIWGGLIVHVGIAWLMELFGLLSLSLQQ